MNLKQLYYFKRLAETEHYTEAASALCITQPALSHAISELEKELGVALFARRGRNIQITPNGKRFLPYVEDALTSLENGRMTLQKSSPAYSDVTFFFTQGTSLTLLQDLKAGKTDLAICSYIADEPDINFIPVIQQELVVVTAREHPLASLYENEVDLGETIHYPYVYFSENSGLRPFIDNVFMQQKLVPDIACYVEEDTAMAGLVSINYGIAIMPRITALSYYPVHILNIKNAIPPRYIYLATMKDRVLSPALQTFKDVIINDCQSFR